MPTAYQDPRVPKTKTYLWGPGGVSILHACLFVFFLWGSSYRVDFCDISSTSSSGRPLAGGRKLSAKRVGPRPAERPRGSRPWRPDTNSVAVQELKLNYHSSEAILFRIYP